MLRPSRETLVVLCLVCVACKHAPAPPRPQQTAPKPVAVVPDAGPDVVFEREACGHPADLAYFFPEGSLVPGTDQLAIDRFVRSWYSGILSRMREPSLSCGSKSEEYRFTNIPTWGKPVAVRIAFSSDGPRVWSIILSGQGGYEPGYPEANAHRLLEPAERDELRRAMARANPWDMPTRDFDRDGFDGTQSVIELRAAQRYHVVDRWSVAPGALRDLCVLFARLGKVPMG